jgi:Immunity protein 50
MAMKQLKGTDKVVEHLGRWSPSDLAYIESLSFTSAMNGDTSKLRIVALFQLRETATQGWPSNKAPSARVSIDFYGVSNFHVKGLGPRPKQIMGFDILDVSDRGLEDISFSVEDYESDQLSFNCEEINVFSVERS